MDGARAVVAVQGAAAADTHEGGRVAQAGGALPPGARNHPTTRRVIGVSSNIWCNSILVKFAL